MARGHPFPKWQLSGLHQTLPSQQRWLCACLTLGRRQILHQIHPQFDSIGVCGYNTVGFRTPSLEVRLGSCERTRPNRCHTHNGPPRPLPSLAGEGILRQRSRIDTGIMILEATLKAGQASRNFLELGQAVQRVSLDGILSYSLSDHRQLSLYKDCSPVGLEGRTSSIAARSRRKGITTCCEVPPSANTAVAIIPGPPIPVRLAPPARPSWAFKRHRNHAYWRAR